MIKPTLQQARVEIHAVSQSPTNGTCCSQHLSICKCKCFSSSLSKNRNQRVKVQNIFLLGKKNCWYGEGGYDTWRASNGLTLVIVDERIRFQLLKPDSTASIAEKEKYVVSNKPSDG